MAGNCPRVAISTIYFQRNLEVMARYFGGQLRNDNTIHHSCLPTVHQSIGLVCFVILCKALCSCWQQLRRTRPEQNLGWTDWHASV